MHGSTFRSRLLIVGVAIAAIVVLSLVVPSRHTAPDDSQQRSALEATSDAMLMNNGVDLLYRIHDVNAAAKLFRAVLRRNPAHYGANVQLAWALALAGKHDEARPVWERVLAMAENVNDTATAAAARRLLKLEPGEKSQDQLMGEGLELLYTRHDPAGAILVFQKVLARNPTHYGAKYQLAAALDQAGLQAEARPWWEKVRAAAESVNDQQTAATAHARLNRSP
jgi:tetratricopeptide (TPR) repeat protein